MLQTEHVSQFQMATVKGCKQLVSDLYYDRHVVKPFLESVVSAIIRL